MQKRPCAHTRTLRAWQTAVGTGFHVRVAGNQLQAFVNDKPLFRCQDGGRSKDRLCRDRFGGCGISGDSRGRPDHTVLFDPLPAPARHWKAIGAGELSLDADQPFNSKFAENRRWRGHGCRAGTLLRFAEGDVFRGSLLVRGESAGGISVRLMSGRYVLAQNSFPPPGKDWTRISARLNPEEDSANATTRNRHPRTLPQSGSTRSA